MIGSIGYAQVTVNATGGVATATYTALRLAFNAINSGTHTGTITIGISANTTETAACVLNGSGAGSASYTSIGIAPTVDGITISITPGISGRGVIELNGSDNVTIDGDNPNTAGTNRNLTIANNASNTVQYTSCIRLALSTLINSCDNIIIRNLNLTGSGTGRNTGAYTYETVTWGVVAAGRASTVSATTAPSTLTAPNNLVPAGQTFTNLTIANNNIQAVSRGISINGSSTTVASSLLISNNTIGNSAIGAVDQVTGIGITAQGSSNGIISGNTIRVEGYLISNFANRGINVGILSAAGVSGMTIEKNNIEKVFNNNVKTRAAIGIEISGGDNHIIKNNFVGQCMNSQVAGISTFNTNNGAAGIRILGGLGHKVYHNTVHLTGAISGITGKNIVAAFEITSLTATGMDVRNNIFSNQITGGNPTLYYTVLISMFLPSGGTSSMNLTLNNNTYYEAGLPQSGIAQMGTTVANLYKAINFNPGATSPANNLRSYTNNLSATGTNDNASYASLNAAPLIAPNNLHISFASSEFPNVDQKGDLTVAVATDFDGDIRPNASTTNPDIGADEFTVIPICSAANGGTITPSTYSSCVGQTVTLTSVGATNITGITYQWMIASAPGGPYTNVSGGSGANTVSYTTPALTLGTNYYQMQTTCSAGPLTGLSNVVTVTVNARPVVSISGTSSFCTGGNTTLTGTGTGTYQWYANDSLIVGATATTYNVNAASFYNLIITNAAGCSDSSATGITVIVNSLPTVTASATPSSICLGETSTLMGSGASSYVWSGGISDNVGFSPSSTATYTVTGTDGNGCINTATQTVTVNSLPTVNTMAMPATVCSGSSTTLMGSGASTYAWSGGVTDNMPFIPVSTATYTVTGTDINGCTNTNIQSVTVNPLPTVTAMATPSTVCAGATSTLMGMGATTYAWSGGITDNVPFTPIATATYSVTGTDGNGCMNTATQSITVNALPSVSAMAMPSAVCAGASSTVMGMGATTYTWSGGITDNVPFTPITTATYTVTGTDGNGCMNTGMTTVTVNLLPTVDFAAFSSSICDNGGAVLLTGGSPSGGTYTGTAVSGGMFDPVISGAGTYQLTYMYTDVNSCSNSDTASITVDVCSGINSSANENQFNIYPNPSNGIIIISIGNPHFSELNITVLDIQGKIIFNSFEESIGNGYKKEIDLNGIAKGIYYIKFNSSNDMNIYKLLIQ